MVVTIQSDGDDLIATGDVELPRTRGDRRRQANPKQFDRRVKAKRDVAHMGIELAGLRNVPARKPNEKIQPARGPQLARAMEQFSEITPLMRKLLFLLAAYADGGTQSPPIRSLAARMTLTMPEVMWLLRALEMEGQLKIKWSKEAGKSNKYTILWLDGE